MSIATAPPTRSVSCAQTRAFTLIEMLVVIAIIAVLGSILFTTISSARSRAAVASCAANLRSIGIGMTQYAQEHNNLYPAAYNNPNGAWPAELKAGGYVADSRIFRCPGDTTKLPANGTSLSYTYCSPIMTGDSYDPYTPLNRMKIELATKQYLIMEWHDSGKTVENGAGVIADWNLGSPESVSKTHEKGGRNFLFADCHVEFRKLEAVRDPSSGYLLNNITSSY